MVKIIHLADTHLGFRLRKNFKNDWFKFGEIRWYENDFYKRWDDFFNYCIDNKDNIDFIVHSGDIFHTPFGENPFPPPEPAREVVVKSLKTFFKETSNKIPIILIDGNHGIYQGYRYSIMDSITSIFPKLHYFSVWDLKHAITNSEPLIVEFPDKSTRFYLFPYFEFNLNNDIKIEYDIWIEKQRPKEDMIEIAVVHGSDIDNTLHEKVKSFNYSYIALGHEHNQRKFSGNAYYSGSFVPLNFDEVNLSNGYLEVIIEKNKNPVVKNHIFEKNRVFEEIEIEVDPSTTNNSIFSTIDEKIEPFKTQKWEGVSAARLKIIFRGNIPLTSFWNLSEELRAYQSRIISGGSYNILQLIIDWHGVSKYLGDELAPEIIEEYILSNPKEEFLEYIHGKIKPAEGYNVDLLAEIAIEAIETSLKKFGGETD